MKPNDISRIKEHELLPNTEQIEVDVVEKPKMKPLEEMSQAEKLRWETLKQIEAMEKPEDRVEEWNLTQEM